MMSMMSKVLMSKYTASPISPRCGSSLLPENRISDHF